MKTNTCSVCAGDGWTYIDTKKAICPRCFELTRGLKLKDALVAIAKLNKIVPPKQQQ